MAYRALIGTSEWRRYRLDYSYFPCRGHDEETIVDTWKHSSISQPVSQPCIPFRRFASGRRMRLVKDGAKCYDAACRVLQPDIIEPALADDQPQNNLNCFQYHEHQCKRATQRQATKERTFPKKLTCRSTQLIWFRSPSFTPTSRGPYFARAQRLVSAAHLSLLILHTQTAISPIDTYCAADMAAGTFGTFLIIGRKR
jgi:hypothetical protein